MDAARIETFLNKPCTLWGDGTDTWRDWLEDVLLQVLKEGEGFSGKRPNCDSGWQWTLAEALTEIEPSIVPEWGEEEVDEGRTQKYAKDIDWDKYEEACEEVVTYIFTQREPITDEEAKVVADMAIDEIEKTPEGIPIDQVTGYGR